jgi:ribonuclease J
VQQGIEVLTDRDELVHVSGHPRRAELVDMYGWVRPQIAIPVHGEALHLHEHAALARRVGVQQVIECRDGDMIRLAPGRAEVIDEVPAARIYKDGRILLEPEARTVPERRRLAFAGVVSVAVAVTQQGEIAGEPELRLTGIPERDAGGELMSEIAYAAVMDALRSLPRPHRRDPDALTQTLARAVRNTLATHWDKKPVCHVHVLTV